MQMPPTADLGRFCEDLRAAVIAGVPLWLGKSSAALPGGKADLHKLTLLEDAVRGWTKQGQSLREVVSRSPELPSQFAAALRVYAETGTMHQALDGLMARGLVRRQLSALIHRTLVYLFLVMGFASLLLLFFSVAIVPSILEVRQDMQLMPTVANQRADGTGGLSGLIITLGVAAVIGLGALLLGRAPELAWLFGGRSVERHWLSANAVQTVRSLTANGMAVDEATALACQLVDGAGKIKHQIELAVRTRAASAEPRKHLEALASEYRSIAAVRLSTLRVVLPIALLCFVGGTVAMIYGVAVFLPIILLLKDLAIPAS